LVDPGKDGAADINLIKNALKTRTEFLAEQGLDIHDVFETLEYEQTLAGEHNLALDAGPTPTIPEPEAPLAAPG
jgi:capsid protein